MNRANEYMNKLILSLDVDKHVDLYIDSMYST